MLCLGGSQASNIDDVLSHHTSFLDNCLKDCMLTNPELLKIFSKMMSVCVMFTNCMQVGLPPAVGREGQRNSQGEDLPACEVVRQWASPLAQHRRDSVLQQVSSHLAICASFSVSKGEGRASFRCQPPSGLAGSPSSVLPWMAVPDPQPQRCLPRPCLTCQHGLLITPQDPREAQGAQGQEPPCFPPLLKRLDSVFGLPPSFLHSACCQVLPLLPPAKSCKNEPPLPSTGTSCSSRLGHLLLCPCPHPLPQSFAGSLGPLRVLPLWPLDSLSTLRTPPFCPRLLCQLKAPPPRLAPLPSSSRLLCSPGPSKASGCLRPLCRPAALLGKHRRFTRNLSCSPRTPAAHQHRLPPTQAGCGVSTTFVMLQVLFHVALLMRGGRYLWMFSPRLGLDIITVLWADGGFFPVPQGLVSVGECAVSAHLLGSLGHGCSGVYPGINQCVGFCGEVAAGAVIGTAALL